MRAAVNDLGRLQVTSDHIPGLMDAAHAQSSDKSSELSAALLRHSVSSAYGQQAMRTLVHWARGRDHTVRRRAVVTGFRKVKEDVSLIQCIAELPREDARSLMKEYLLMDGDTMSIARWLQIVGSELRNTNRPIPGTDGWNLLGGIRRLGEVAMEAVGTVVDATESAFKAMGTLTQIAGDALAAAAGWTVEKVADVVEALIVGGKSVTQILSAVTGNAMKVVKKALRALKRMHHTVTDIVDAATNLLPEELRVVVRALVQIGTSPVNIIVSFASRSLDGIRTALEAMLAENVRLMTVLHNVCKHIGSELRRGFIEGLIALGKTPEKILEEAVKSSFATAMATFAVFLEIWGGYRELTFDEKQDARRIFGWSIDLDRVKIANGTIPTDIAFLINKKRPFTTMYVIDFPRDVNVEKNRGTLIHELTHVWQAVTDGPIYMVEALHSQWTGRGYRVTDQDLRNSENHLEKLEREQQAMVVERYWRGRYNSESVDWRKYEILARQVYSPKISRMMIELPLSVGRLPVARANIRTSIT